MTRIGEPQRTVRDVPVPYPMPKVRPLPEKEPVPIRRVPIKISEPLKKMMPVGKEPERKVWARAGMTVEEIPYACPQCGREMTMEDGILFCPEHGVMYYG